MTSFSYGTQWPIYAKQWDAMEAIDEEWAATFSNLANTPLPTSRATRVSRWKPGCRG